MNPQMHAGYFVDRHSQHQPTANDPASPLHCPACFAHGPFKRHALRETWWRDVPQGSRPQVRRGHMVRWRCLSCKQTHTIQPQWAAHPRRMTHDLKHWILQQLTRGAPIHRISAESGLDSKTIRSLRAGLEQFEG